MGVSRVSAMHSSLSTQGDDIERLPVELLLHPVIRDAILIRHDKSERSLGSRNHRPGGGELERKWLRGRSLPQKPLRSADRIELLRFELPDPQLQLLVLRPQLGILPGKALLR